ncbi:MAG: amino-acid N-acetyltransferase [Pseudohongiellaceae bacterium]|jgi:amino-acid N-acetyltransferase
MLNNQQLIEWFRASTTYINAHRGQVFVVLLSGEALSDSNLPNIIHDLNLLHSLGVKLVLVTGARPQITSALANQGIDSSFHKQMRITRPEALDVILACVGRLNIKTEAHLSMGLANSPMDGADIRVCRGNFVTAKPYGIHDGIDHHYTGRVRKIQSEAIHQQLQSGNMVLLSNLGYSLTGEVFNLTAEEIATETAVALGADKLILLTPAEGIFDRLGDLIPSLNQNDAIMHMNQLTGKNDSESACMKKALQAAISAFNRNVHRSHLISFKNNGALLQELFTREGKGTLISRDNFDLLRQATIDDISSILALIKPLEENGTLVSRSRELLETEVDNFQVIEFEGAIIACAALYSVTEKLGEIACLAIHENYQKKGYGDQLLLSLETKAKENGLREVLVLTTVTDHWFLERGFKPGTANDLPESRKQLYNNSRNSKVLLKGIS